MSHPPHLPQNISAELRANAWERTRTIGISVFLSLAAGIVGALIVFAWVIPGGYAIDGLWVPRIQNTANVSPYSVPDTSLVRKVKNMTVEVFLESKLMDNDFYTKDAVVGKGVMLSSNGWGVVYAPDLLNSGVISKIKIRDAQNTWFTPTSVVADKKNDLVYFKLSGTEFYVASFPDWRIIESGLGVWVYTHSEWRRQTIGNQIEISKEPIFSASDKRTRYTMLPLGISSEGLVISDTGSLLGFIVDDGTFNDAWIIENSIPELLQSGTIAFSDPEWKGSWVETVEGGKVVTGFLIDSVGKTSMNGIKHLDIVREINGTPITETNLYQLIREKSLKVTVWRDGALFDILVSTTNN